MTENRLAYSPASLAERWSCSAELVKKLIKTGQLASFNYGKMIRITATEVDRYEGVTHSEVSDRQEAPAPPPETQRAPLDMPKTIIHSYSSKLPDWPQAMKLKTAAAYLDLAEAAFEREVYAGRLPPSFLLGGRAHWRRDALDKALTVISGENAVPDHIKRFEERRRGDRSR